MTRRIVDKGFMARWKDDAFPLFSARPKEALRALARICAPVAERIGYPS
jgi:hypothetical protein